MSTTQTTNTVQAPPTLSVKLDEKTVAMAECWHWHIRWKVFLFLGRLLELVHCGR